MQILSERKPEIALLISDNVDFGMPRWLSGEESVCPMEETQETGQSLGWGDLLEQDMAARPSVLAWKILWTKEPGRYSPRGCRVGHDWGTECPCTTRTSEQKIHRDGGGHRQWRNIQSTGKQQSYMCVLQTEELQEVWRADRTEGRERFTAIIGDFNTPLSTLERTRWKKCRRSKKLNNRTELAFIEHSTQEQS